MSSAPISFVAASDWHVAESAWKRRGIDGDSYFSLRQIIDFCLQHEVPLVAAGDLLDTQDPSPRDIEFLHRSFDRMAAREIDVWFTQGQHERDIQTPWFSTHLWPKHVHGREFEIGPFRLRGLDWQPASRLAAALSEVPADTDFLVCHQVWADFMGTYVESEGSLDQVPASNVITGDFHTHTTKTYSVAGGRGRFGLALSSGSICMQSINEEETKHFYIVREDCGYESIPIRCRAVFRSELNTGDDLDRFLSVELPAFRERAKAAAELLPPELHRPLLSVRFAMDIPQAFARLTAASRDEFHLFAAAARPRSDEGIQAEASARAVIAGGLKGAAAHTLPEGPVRQLVLELLDAKNVVEALDAAKARYLE